MENKKKNNENGGITQCYGARFVPNMLVALYSYTLTVQHTGEERENDWTLRSNIIDLVSGIIRILLSVNCSNFSLKGL